MSYPAPQSTDGSTAFGDLILANDSAKTSSFCQDVLVNDTAETIPAQNTSVAGCRRRCNLA